MWNFRVRNFKIAISHRLMADPQVLEPIQRIGSDNIVSRR